MATESIITAMEDETGMDPTTMAEALASVMQESGGSLLNNAADGTVNNDDKLAESDDGEADKSASIDGGGGDGKGGGVDSAAAPAASAKPWVDVPSGMWCPRSRKLLLNAAASRTDGLFYDKDTLIAYRGLEDVVPIPIRSQEVKDFVDQHRLLTPEEFVDALIAGNRETLKTRPHPLQCVMEPEGCLGKSAVQIAASQSQWATIHWLLSLRNASPNACQVTLNAVLAAVSGRCTKVANWQEDSAAVAGYLSGVQLLIENLDKKQQLLQKGAEGAAIVAAAVKTGCVDMVRRLHTAGFPFTSEAGLFMGCESIPMADFLLTTGGLRVTDGNYRCLIESVGSPVVWHFLWKKASHNNTELPQQLSLLRLVLMGSFCKPRVETFKALLNGSPALKAACADPQNGQWALRRR